MVRNATGVPVIKKFAARVPSTRRGTKSRRLKFYELPLRFAANFRAIGVSVRGGCSVTVDDQEVQTVQKRYSEPCLITLVNPSLTNRSLTNLSSFNRSPRSISPGTAARLYSKRALN
jgi:hypothetical protein